MRKSRKGMSSTLFAIVIVVIVVSLFGGVFLRLVNKGKQTGLDVLGWQQEEQEKKGPALDEFITITRADSASGVQFEILTFGATADGSFDKIACGGLAGCPILVFFDRKIQSFSDDYLVVMQKEKWASGWQKSTSVSVRAVKDYRVTLTGFEKGFQYFIKFSTTVDYVEYGTEKKFKLNSATAGLRFETNSE